ncbi:efflux RND transporter permease subunit [Orbus sasakiae]|uniref:Efflux pump membrane transporter n=1 Tax=Orbus sasakiae TaxID=1078475 RepID=A0ABP9NBI4_9GAMM
MSRFFIERPNFAWVIAIFIALFGLLAMRSLAVSQYPNVAPPQITISASYPGASAILVDKAVTSIIEEELNGASGLLYFDSSSSSAGSAETVVTFKPGTDPDMAQVDVQNRLKNAESRLPESVRQMGINVEKTNSGFLMIYSLTYKDSNSKKDVVGLADYAARNINNEIRRITGVGRVQMFGSEAAMRIWVDPQKLIGYGLSVADINQAISTQNAQVPAGSFGSKPNNTDQELTAAIVVKGTLDTPEEFGRIILRANQDGSTVTLSDVARIEIGRQDYNFQMTSNGKPSVGVAVQLAPGANALQTAEAVKNRLQELSASFPSDLEYSVPFDTSLFVDAAIGKVIHTLGEAMILVFLVMFLFLQNVRYTLIPTIVVPVCLLGTLSVMSLLGFSVNMMTMFGMVLAIGILVDDAIVVVENVERIMAHEGLSPKKATIKAMQQVSSAIVGITLVLSAVFLPLAFMSGSVGVIYQQFSLSLSISILFSGFLALTLTPALCATLLKAIPQGHHAEKRGFFGWFNRYFNLLTKRFTYFNSRLIKRTGRYMVIYAVIVAGLAMVYKQLPESFVPIEDQGYYIVNVQLPPAATYQRATTQVKSIDNAILARPATQSTTFIMGYSFAGNGENAALGFVVLKDWKKRAADQSAFDEVMALSESLSQLNDGNALAIEPPPIDGLGNSGGFSLRLIDRGGVGRQVLTRARDQLLEAANQSPVIAYAIMEGLEDAPQWRLDIDRQKAESLGVTFDVINTALASSYGSAMINDFSNVGRMQRVIVQADSKDRMTPDSILKLQVPNTYGELVPIASFAKPHWEKGAVQVTRYNGYPAFRISGDAFWGYSTGQAMAEMEKFAAKLPKGIDYEWTGLSYQEKLSGSQAPMLFALSFIVVFLLLVALYESWLIPTTVMLIVPIGALGSVLATLAMMMPNDVYFKVGLITIIGLATKNAILIIEFAKSQWEGGMSLQRAALNAVCLRFRPIVMTSLAFILGVIPLAIASGEGAESQKAIGTGVIGGMLTATTIGIIFVPIFFVWILSFFKPKKSKPRFAMKNLEE